MKDNELLPMLLTHPAVFAVGREYQITVPVKGEVVFWVTVGENTYYDHQNGIMKSAGSVRRVTVPMAVLDKEKSYTVHCRKIIKRLPYRTQTKEPMEKTYPFHPVTKVENINIYHLSDTHGKFKLPACAGRYFGDNLDLLVLNGDIPNHCGDMENAILIFELCSAITEGTRPCVFSRGNHDMRGSYAEMMTDFVPSSRGNTYYTFRLGALWGIMLDCGEDKPDDHEEYGHMICCHEFRRQQTEYLKSVIEDAANEYQAEGVQYRLVISHVPFSMDFPSPFNIEQDTYTLWLKLLKENVKPDLMLCGHLHQVGVSQIGGKYDQLGQACPVIVGSDPIENDFIGCGITLEPGKATICFTNSIQQAVETHELSI